MNAPQRDDPDTEENLEKVKLQGDQSWMSLSNIYLGTAQKPYSLDVLQQKRIHDPVFKDFLKQLHAFVSAQPDFGRDIVQKVQLSMIVWVTLQLFHFQKFITLIDHRISLYKGIL